jgi:hypothetical protein
MAYRIRATSLTPMHISRCQFVSRKVMRMTGTKFDPVEWLADAATHGKLPTILRGAVWDYLSLPPLPPDLLEQFSRHSTETIDAISKFKMV